MNGDDLSLEHHRMIYDHIMANPGSHLRKISRELCISLSTLRYHLGLLEKNGIITGRREQNKKVYFASGRIGATDKNMASLLQQKRFRDIVLTILIHPGANHAEISEKLGLKPPTLSKYVKVLQERNIITNRKEGRKKLYSLVDEKNVIEVLLTYRRSFWDSFVDNVLEIYFER